MNLSEKPNVLIILVDDMGYSDPGCFGGEIHTPNINKLAEGGLRFTHFYNSGRCWPTRSSLLTGYYANAIGMDPIIREKACPSWVTTIPAYLREAGYRSYHSGKYHFLNNKPPVRAGGFDQSYWIERGNDFYYDFVHYRNDSALTPFSPEDSALTTTVITDRALDMLKEHEGAYAESPFFLYLAYRAPHFPLMAWEEDIKRYKDRYTEGWDVLRQERWKRMFKAGLINHDLPPREEKVNQTYEHLMKDRILLDSMTPGEVLFPVAWESLSQEEKEFQALKMSIHAAMVDRVDQETGRVLTWLENHQKLENTVIFFLSDNGASAEIMIRGNGHDRTARPGSAESYLCLGPGWAGASNTPFRRYKSWTHEGGIATPLIVHWPEGIKEQGSLRAAPGHVVDLLPTLLDLAGLKQETELNGIPVPPLHGASLVPAFTEGGSITRDFLYFNHHGTFADDKTNRALRMGNWKIVASGTDGYGWELYNLEKDRGEQRDLAGEMPEFLEQMVRKWEETEKYYQELSGGIYE
jgi:arylsulfatase